MQARAVLVTLLLVPLSATPPIRGRAPRAQAPGAEYSMDIRLLPGSSRLAVTGTVRLDASPAARDTIRLVLSSWMPRLEATVVEPAGYDGATLTTDGADGDRTWRLALPRPLPGGVPVTVRFAYTSDSVRAAQLRVTPEGSLAGAGGEIWYPRTGFDSLATGVLRFHVPAGETVVSNGTLDEAGSDPAAGEFVHRVTDPVRFGFASGRYVRYHASAPRAVSLYLLRPRADAPGMLRRVARMLTALEGQFGGPSAPDYAVVEVQFGGSLGGSSEFGFFMVSRSYVEQGLPAPFIAHELGHAWWGNRIGTRPGPGRALLSEGLASYGMLRALEVVEGESAAAAYRRSRYQGAEFVNAPAEYFALASAGIEAPIGVFVPRTQYEILMMHRMANTRGWFLLDMMSREVGRTRFAAALRSIARSYAGRGLSFDDFRREIEARAGRDLRWFFDDWFLRTGAPDYRLTWRRTATGIEGHITQSGPLFRATVPVEMAGSRGRRVRRPVWVGDSSVVFRWRVPFAVEEVTLDPDDEVLRWTPGIRAAAEARRGLTAADFERRFGDRRKALDLYRAALDSVSVPDTAGLRFLLGYGLATGALAEGDSAAARAALVNAVSAAIRDRVTLPRAYLLLARLEHAGGREEAAERAAWEALAADAAVGMTTGVTATIRGLDWLRPSRCRSACGP